MSMKTSLGFKLRDDRSEALKGRGESETGSGGVGPRGLGEKLVQPGVKGGVGAVNGARPIGFKVVAQGVEAVGGLGWHDVADAVEPGWEADAAGCVVADVKSAEAEIQRGFDHL